MNLVIESDFIELQKKTTHVLIEQKLFHFEHKQAGSFLNEINSIKEAHAKLIPYYGSLIELVVSFLEKSQPIEELVLVSESINNLVATTNRLLQSLQDGKQKSYFAEEVKRYTILLDDINEILSDIQNRINCDTEMAGLLDSL